MVFRRPFGIRGPHRWAVQRRRDMTAGAATRSWIEAYYAVLDEGRLDDGMKYFAPDAVMRFANEPPVVGSDAIRRTSREMLDVFGLRHSLKEIWEPEQGVVLVELDVTYVLRADGS